MIQAEVLVIGAGPAGIAAATAAAEHDRKVIVLDDNPAPGGQIWRAQSTALHRRATRDLSARERALQRLTRSGAELFGGHRVYDAPAPSLIRALREDADSSTAVTFRYDRLILATGARERFLPFAGWTTPGVIGAGGLEALVKGGYPVAGKRVVVAGTGLLLLAVAAHLHQCGASIQCIAEQAPAARLAAFAGSLWSHPGKLWQGAGYRAALARTPFRTGCWPVEALAAEGQLRTVRLTNGSRTWVEECDLLACGFHLVPNTELASLLGCEFNGSFVRVNAQQQTSVPGVYCVGEPTAVGGLESALLEGEIAGLTCAGQRVPPPLLRRAAKQRLFADRLEAAFALREELRAVPAETIVCRCEDVPLSRLAGYSGWTDAKLQTRCGMGPCQGRVCGPAVEFLLGWKPVSIRPPVFPVPVDALCIEDHAIEDDKIEENA